MPYGKKIVLNATSGIIRVIQSNRLSLKRLQRSPRQDFSESKVSFRILRLALSKVLPYYERIVYQCQYLYRNIRLRDKLSKVRERYRRKEATAFVVAQMYVEKKMVRVRYNAFGNPLEGSLNGRTLFLEARFVEECRNIRGRFIFIKQLIFELDVVYESPSIC